LGAPAEFVDLNRMTRAAMLRVVGSHQEEDSELQCLDDARNHLMSSLAPRHPAWLGDNIFSKLKAAKGEF